jgi:ribosome biogenesis protein SSF1/2
VPRGPTLSFRVSSYMLLKDVVSSLKHCKTHQHTHESAPLLIMNGFDESLPQHKLLTTTFQNMLPAVNVKTVKLSSIKRCLLLNYSAESDSIELRHYSISATPVGVNKAVKKLLKKVPDLSRYSDISEFLTNGYFSESDGEDGPDNQVELPQNLSGRGNLKSNRSAVRLTELGPRLTLKLVKIQEGVGEGEVLYHSHVKKTAEEKKKLREKIQKQKVLKEKRKKEQQKNIERKKKEQEKESSKKRKRGLEKEVYSDDDDVQYYKDEIGVMPDAELLLKSKRTKRSENFSKNNPKRVKFDSSINSSKTKIEHSKSSNVKGVAFRRKRKA